MQDHTQTIGQKLFFLKNERQNSHCSTHQKDRQDVADIYSGIDDVGIDMG